MGFSFLPSGSTRWGRLSFWLALAGVICLFPLFFVGGPGWSGGPLIQSAWNLGHPIFFALLTVTVRPWRFASGWRLWALASIVVLVLGVAIEFAQSLDGRDMDVRDMFRNLTGLWAVLAVQPWAGFQSSFPVRDWLLRAIALVLLAIDPVSVTRIAIQQIQVSHLLPELYDFQHEHPERFWRGNVSRSSGEDCGPITDNALSIALTTRRFTGVALDNLPSDWRHHDGLAFVIWNPQNEAINLTLRINDLTHEHHSNQFHDRFNRTFRIKPGINHIHQSLEAVASAPREREMDMDEIRRLMFFTSDLSQPGRLCLTQLRLTTRP